MKLTLIISALFCVFKMFSQKTELGQLSTFQAEYIQSFSIDSTRTFLLSRRIDSRYSDVWLFDKNAETCTLVDSVFAIDEVYIQDQKLKFYMRYYENNQSQYWFKSISPTSTLQNFQYFSTSSNVTVIADQELNQQIYFSASLQPNILKRKDSGVYSSTVTSIPKPIFEIFEWRDTLRVASYSDSTFKCYSLINNQLELKFSIYAPTSNRKFNIIKSNGSILQFSLLQYNVGQNYLTRYFELQNVTPIEVPTISTGIPNASFYPPYNDFQSFFIKMLDTNHFIYSTYDKGTEFASRQNDTLIIENEYNQGAFSSICNIKSISNLNQHINLVHSKNQDTIYALMTNGNDSKDYLCIRTDNSVSSLFPIEKINEIIWSELTDNYLFVWRTNTSGLSFEKYNLLGPFEPQPAQKPISEEWANDANFCLNFSTHPHDISEVIDAKITKEGEVYQLIRLRYLGDFVHFQSDHSTDTVKACTFLYKYDKYGNVSWKKQLGDNYTLFHRKPRMTFDSEDNIYLYWNFYGTGLFENNYLQNVQTENHLSKLNALDGSSIWDTILNSTYYVDSFEPLDLTFLPNNTLSMLYKFYSGSSTIYNSSVPTPYNYSFGIAKFKADGELISNNYIWPNGLNDPNKKVIIHYDEPQEKYYLGCSDGFYNVSQSCAYEEISHQISVFNSSNELENHLFYESSDLGSLVSMENSTQKLYGIGYFRGDLEINSFETESPMGQYCHRTVAYLFTMNKMNRQVDFLSKSITEFKPISSIVFKDTLYLLGGDLKDSLHIIAFDKLGKEIGYFSLENRIIDDNDYMFGNLAIDVNEKHLIVFGKDFEESVNFPLYSKLEFGTAFSTLKMKKPNWRKDKIWFQSVDKSSFENTNETMILFPNPTVNTLNLIVKQYEDCFLEYEVYNINGQKLIHNSLPPSLENVIDVSNISVGTYILKLKNNKETKTIKFIKI